MENQRTDPHHLIPDGTKYVFQRADPNDPIISQLQSCSHFSSVNHLLNEVDDIMDILKELDPNQVGTEQALDMEEDEGGSETQESSSVEPPSSTTHVGEQKGVNKRVHDKIVALGHKTHPSQSQRMSNVAGSNWQHQCQHCEQFAISGERAYTSH